jgi:hypothetical protein
VRAAGGRNRQVGSLVRGFAVRGSKRLAVYRSQNSKSGQDHSVRYAEFQREQQIVDSIIGVEGDGALNPMETKGESSCNFLPLGRADSICSSLFYLPRKWLTWVRSRCSVGERMPSEMPERISRIQQSSISTNFRRLVKGPGLRNESSLRGKWPQEIRGSTLRLYQRSNREIGKQTILPFL